MLLATEKLSGSHRDARLSRARAQRSQNQALDQPAVCILRSSEADRPPLIASVRPVAIPMPIPNATGSTAATEKVRDSLLNPEHPDGGSKAAWFQSLGYGVIIGMSWQWISWPIAPRASSSLPSGRLSA